VIQRRSGEDAAARKLMARIGAQVGKRIYGKSSIIHPRFPCRRVPTFLPPDFSRKRTTRGVCSSSRSLYAKRAYLALRNTISSSEGRVEAKFRTKKRRGWKLPLVLLSTPGNPSRSREHQPQSPSVPDDESPQIWRARSLARLPPGHPAGRIER
jgi:hypothetical protein